MLSSREHTERKLRKRQTLVQSSHGSDRQRKWRCNSAVCHRKKLSVATKPGNPMWVIRIFLLVLLASVAVTFGFGAYYFISKAEQELGDSQYEAVISRVMDLALEVVARRRVAVKSMAKIAASAFPKSASWPMVAIPAFEEIAQDLIATSGSKEFSFHPKVIPRDVSPGQQEAFEEFAYDYFYNIRNPPFPPGTAVHNFGRGIWRTQDNISRPGVTSDLRVHDTDGKTLSWNSSYQLLFPEMQSSNRGPNGRLFLLHNVYAEPSRGRPIDQVISCADHRQRLRDTSIDCGAVSSIFSWNRESFLIQPIYPAMDSLYLAGIIISTVSWDKIIETLFTDTHTTGIVAILEADGRSFTYRVSSGVVEFCEFCFDDHELLANVALSSYEKVVEFPGELLCGGSCPNNYTLTLVPSNEFFDAFKTSSPTVSSVGAASIVIFTSLIFLMYDFFVRREFLTNKQILNAKRQFMRFVSHEVRTPLNAVSMGLSILSDDMARVADEAAALATKSDIILSSPSISEKIHGWMAMVNDVKNSTDLSVDVLNDLLNYDKIESGNLRLELSLISLWTLIQEASNEFRLSALDKRINFELESIQLPKANSADLEDSQRSGPRSYVHQTKIVADRIRITQVFRNLVSNAIKFTDQGGYITIRPKFIPIERKPESCGPITFKLADGSVRELEQAGSVEVDCIDNGVGMSPEQLRTIFGDGVQFNASTLQAGAGSGLGLYISKGIVEQHGGSISVFSAGLGHGSTFRVSLPLYLAVDDNGDEGPLLEDKVSSAESCPSAPRAETYSNYAITPLKVLVVDDVSTNRKLLKKYLSNRGHNVDDAEDGQKAVELFMKALRESSPYDTILMDSEMPVMTGPEAARRIRSFGSNVFIIGVTGNVLTEDVDHFISCGAHTVMAKPIDFEKLEELWIERNIALRSAVVH